jgi:hypothetical protein
LALPSKKAAIASLAAACAIGVSALGATAGGAETANKGGSCGGGGGSGGIGLGGGCSDHHYVNPIHKKLWYASRIDMGVDYMPLKKVAVRAIGDARVIVSDANAGWPGGHYMVYKLLSGDHKGNRIFVAESLKNMARRGKRVSAGDVIAKALPTGTGIETGFADSSGQPRAAPCYYEGRKTNSGKEMARFLRNLGAPLGDKVGPGPDYPSGKRC